MQKVLWIAIFYYIYKKIKSLGLSEKQLLSYCRQIARKSNKINSPQFTRDNYEILSHTIKNSKTQKVLPSGSFFNQYARLAYDLAKV